MRKQKAERGRKHKFDAGLLRNGPIVISMGKLAALAGDVQSFEDYLRVAADLGVSEAEIARLHDFKDQLGHYDPPLSE